jgi:CRISPR-associated protein Csc3
LAVIHQELLRRAVSERHPMIQHFVATLAPQLLLAFSRIPALGGSGTNLPGEHDPLLPPEAVAYTPELRARFSQANPDQSLAAHLFNGIFAGARVAELLPPAKQLRDLEWQIWILGFIVHDYTKIHGISIEPRYMPQIRNIIAQQGERLKFATFLPTWRDYLDDITFLAQNTQKVSDAAMNWSLFPDLQLDERRILTLRYLASFADLLVHITRPADVAERDSRGRNTAQNLRATLGLLFGTERPPRLAYHQLTEARGLLSNLINNGLMRAAEQQGYQPYLFFPDGVVYLVAGDAPARLDQDALIDELWREVGATLAGIGAEQAATEEEGDEGEVADLDGGLQISRTKDYMKVPPVLYELLSPPTLLLAARQAALRVRKPLAAERLGAEVADQQGLQTGRLPAKEKKALFAQLGAELLSQDGLPDDARVDQLAEYLSFIWRRMLRHWFPKAAWPTPLLLDLLNLSDEITPERAEAARSGTPTGWFYVAARYLQREQLDPYQLDERMAEIGNQVLGYLAKHRLVPPAQGRFEAAFRDYVRASVTFDGQMLAAPAVLRDRFARELNQYSERKAANKVQCSLCSSPYEARQQDKSEVLFKPQQYSNKTRLDTSTVVRGICPICAIELMLRQVQQGMRPGTAQDEKPVTLWLYPTYFFTAETARVVHDFITVLRDLSLLAMIFSHLERNGFTLEALAAYDSFVAQPADEPAGTTWTIRAPAFSDRDLASLFFFSLRPAMSKPSDTDAWIVPIFYTLALPLLLDIKVVVSASFVPIYSSGSANV